MTIQELRVFISEWFCGCGDPSNAARVLRDILALHPLYEHRQELEQILPDEGLRYLMLYTLDHFDLTDHGSSIGGAWLTDKGRSVLDALHREAPAFERLSGMWCIHGYDTDTQCSLCEAELRGTTSCAS
jgi:hypothetical protein